MPAPITITEETLHIVRRLRENKATLDVIAERIGCSRTTVTDILNRHGIPRNGRSPHPPRPITTQTRLDPNRNALIYPLTPEARALRPLNKADEPLPAGHPLTWGLIQPQTKYPQDATPKLLRPIQREPGWTDPNPWRV